MNETSQFHPEIEKALETSGENIGRVKDIELAHDAALGENDVRSAVFVPGEERIDHLTDNYLKATIAKRAVSGAAKNDLDNLAITGAFDKPNLGINTEHLVSEASQVADDYDRVERMADEARQERTDFQENIEDTVEKPELGVIEEVEGRDTPRGTQVSDTEEELACRRVMDLIANGASDDDATSLQKDYELIKGIIMRTIGGHSEEYAVGHATIKRYAVEQRWEVSGLERDSFSAEKARDIEFAWNRASIGRFSAREAYLKAKLDDLRVEERIAEARGDDETLGVTEQQRLLIEHAEKVLRSGDPAMLEN